MDDLERAGMGEEEWAQLQSMIAAAQGMKRVYDAYVLAGFSEPLTLLTNAIHS